MFDILLGLFTMAVTVMSPVIAFIFGAILIGSLVGYIIGLAIGIVTKGVGYFFRGLRKYSFYVALILIPNFAIILINNLSSAI